MKGAVNMFCKNCGYQNADDAKRCSKCGSPLYSFQNKMSSNYNNASNVNQVNQGQMYYSSTPVAQRKSKLPIIIVASILAVVLFVGGIFGFLFISSKNSVAIPEWSDTITVMFNDVKKEGKFETAINKHSFENQFKDMSSDQRMVLSVLDALIKDMSFRCSNYKDVFYYDLDRNKSYYGFERYYEQNPNINVRVEILRPIANPREELDKMVGCDNIKQRMEELVSLSSYNQMKQELFPDSKPHEVSLHSVFLGRPGTGKTTVCKIFGSLLRQAGVLSKGHVVVCNRGTFIGTLWGDEERSMQQVLEMAQGGVLMFDEAYL